MSTVSLINFKVLSTDTHELVADLLAEYQAVVISVTDESFNSTLEQQLDLAAVFMAIDLPISDKHLEMLKNIRRLRPELPLFVRHPKSTKRKLRNTLVEKINSFNLPDKTVPYCCYAIDDLADLKKQIDAFIFKNFYPPRFIEALISTSIQAIEHQFLNLTVKHSNSYIINDKYIYGELFSYIPLESDWCRGIMTMHARQEKMLSLIQSGHTHLSSENLNFRQINDLLNEVTNEIWGRLKSKFFTREMLLKSGHYLIQVPFIVNHDKGFFSVGSADPHLCLLYEIYDESGKNEPTKIHQRIAFHLEWRPENCPVPVEEDDDDGGLEFF